MVPVVYYTYVFHTVLYLNSIILFFHYSPLKPKDLPIEQLITMFKTSKARKPLRGAIILNEALDKVKIYLTCTILCCIKKSSVLTSARVFVIQHLGISQGEG